MDSDSHQNTAPRTVKIAALLLMTSVALRTVDFVIRIGPHTAKSYFIWAGSAILLLLFAFAFLRGKNWARWVYLFPIFIGFLSQPDIFQRALARSTFSMAYLCVQTLLQVSSAILVFLSPSTAWFKRAPDNKSPQASVAPTSN